MASLYELRDMPKEGDYFLSFDDLLKVIRDAFVKHKFSFKTLYKDPSRVQYICTNKQCPWLITATLNKENKNKVIVNKIVSDYVYISDSQAKRGAATCQD
jgi:hypothetical protein